MRGSIDLWFEEAGEIQLVDYKTDVDVHPKSYSTQLARYSHALDRALGVTPSAAHLHYLRSDKIISVPVDRGAITSAVQLIADLRQAQDTYTKENNAVPACFTRGLSPASILNP